MNKILEEEQIKKMAELKTYIENRIKELEGRVTLVEAENALLKIGMSEFV